MLREQEQLRFWLEKLWTILLKKIYPLKILHFCIQPLIISTSNQTIESHLVLNE